MLVQTFSLIAKWWFNLISAIVSLPFIVHVSTDMTFRIIFGNSLSFNNTVHISSYEDRKIRNMKNIKFFISSYERIVYYCEHLLRKWAWNNKYFFLAWVNILINVRCLKYENEYPNILSEDKNVYKYLQIKIIRLQAKTE